MTRCLSKDDIFLNLFNLTKYEQKEIWSYMEEGVYFLGLGAKKVSSKMFRGQRNFGDSCGYYRIVKGDHIKYRFEIIKYLGQGSFGVVVEALDHKTKNKVAIKIMREGESYNEKYIEEIKILQYLNMCFHDNCEELGCMLENFEFRGFSCIVLKLCQRDLYYEMKKNHFRSFDLTKVKIISHGIVKGLKQLHDVNLYHGDIKIDNIAFQSRNSTNVTIIDLGNCKFGQHAFEDYGQGRYYRPPEVIFHLPSGPAADMWALGCSVYEIATGNVLFRGASKEDQLIRIIEVLGIPPYEMLCASSRTDKYFYEKRYPKYCTVKEGDEYIEMNAGKSCGCTRRLPGMRTPFAGLDKRSLILSEFIQKCIKWIPEERMTSEDAINHPWFLESKFSNILSPITAVKISISSHTALEQKSSCTYKKSVIRKLYHSASEKKLCKSLSLVDYKDSESDVNLKWSLVCSKFLKFKNNK